MVFCTFDSPEYGGKVHINPNQVICVYESEGQTILITTARNPDGASLKIGVSQTVKSVVSQIDGLTS